MKSRRRVNSTVMRSPTMNRTRILGAYVLVGAVLQVFLYLALSITRNCDWLCCFDSRIGIGFFESWAGRAQMAPSIVRWFAVGWILALGVLLFTGRRLVKAYIISEIVLSLPNIIMFAMVALASLAPSPHFSIRSLLWPIIVMVVFSVIPLILAFRSRRQPPILTGSM